MSFQVVIGERLTLAVVCLILSFRADKMVSRMPAATPTDHPKESPEVRGVREEGSPALAGVPRGSTPSGDATLTRETDGKLSAGSCHRHGLEIMGTQAKPSSRSTTKDCWESGFGCSNEKERSDNW